MGKGTITRVDEDGLYQVEVHRDWSKITAHIAEITKAIETKRDQHNKAVLKRFAKQEEKDRAVVDMNDAISAYEAETNPPQIKEKWELVKTAAKACNQLAMEIVDLKSVELRLELEVVALLTEWNSIDRRDKTNPTVAMYCADFTDDLTVGATVGTIDVLDRDSQIRPAFSDHATYVAATDGDINPSNNLTTAGVFWNWAMRAGYEKWKPLYRVGTITNLQLDTADVELDPCEADDLNVNQGATLTSVDVFYMDCDWRAFVIGDRVIVEFVARDWTQPRVIGFYNGPRECPVWKEDFTGVIYDMGTNHKETFPDEWRIPGDTHSMTVWWDTTPLRGDPYYPNGEDFLRCRYGREWESFPGWGAWPWPPPEKQYFSYMSALMTENHHKLIMHDSPWGVMAGSTLSIPIATDDPMPYWGPVATIINGDCEYIRLPSGQQSSDRRFTGWDYMEVKFSVSADNGHEIYVPALVIAFQNGWYDYDGGGNGSYMFYANPPEVTNFYTNAIAIGIRTPTMVVYPAYGERPFSETIDSPGYIYGVFPPEFHNRIFYYYTNDYLNAHGVACTYPGNGYIVGMTELETARTVPTGDAIEIFPVYPQSPGTNITVRIDRAAFNLPFGFSAITVAGNANCYDENPHTLSVDYIAFFRNP